MSKPSYSKDDLANISDEYIERKMMEHYRIDRLANSNDIAMSYKVLKHDKLYPHPPIHYQISYSLKSYTGIKEDLSPIEGRGHVVELRIPGTFPEQPIEARIVTQSWHPNILPPDQGGYICTNSRGFGSLYQIDELTVRIGEMLQYKNYMAQNRKPWPENDRAAKWVLEHAEPRGIVNIKEKKFLDDYVWKQFFDQGYPETLPLTADGENNPNKNGEDDIIFETRTYGNEQDNDIKDPKENTKTDQPSDHNTEEDKNGKDNTSDNNDDIVFL